MALIKCKQCGNENAKDAKTCPKCGTSLKMGMGTKILIGFGCLVLLSAFGHAVGDQERAAETGVGSGSTGHSNAALAAPAAPTPTRVDIHNLLSEYKSNEVRADAAFKGKWIVTTGSVGDVKKDITDDVYVTLGTGQQFEIPEVQCFVAKNQVAKAAQFSKGDTVTVVGRVEGLMMNVLVHECSFQ